MAFKHTQSNTEATMQLLLNYNIVKRISNKTDSHAAKTLAYYLIVHIFQLFKLSKLAYPSSLHPPTATYLIS